MVCIQSQLLTLRSIYLGSRSWKVSLTLHHRIYVPLNVLR